MTLSSKKPGCKFKKHQRQQKRQARRLNRIKTKKKKVDKLKKEKRRILRLHNKMKDLFDNVDDVAKATKFLIRTSKILPLAFIVTLAYGLFGDGGKSLDLLASNMNNWFGITVSGQALSERLKKKSTLKFLEKIFLQVLDFQLSKAFKGKKLFPHFKSVKLQDSTTFELEKENKKGFKGHGGGASPAGMKLDFCYNLSNWTVAQVEIESATTSDQSFSDKALKYVKKGELLVRDLGYFSLEAILTMINKGIYFLSRLQKGCLLFLDKQEDIYKFLETHTKDNQTIDKDVFIGKQKVGVRLIAIKVPKEVQEKRIERFKKARKNQPSKDYITWCGYSIFITNIPRQMFAANTILEIYKIRWQIELFFKTIKQVIKIQIIRTKSVNATKCMIYAKLISMLTASVVISYAQSVCEKEEELSFDKAMKWLHNDNCLGQAIAKKEIKELLEKMIKELTLMCKNPRIKIKSTYRHLEEFIQGQIAA